jgi:uncharacterized protein YdeI (YjbR/CyaY-like superfamily)
MTSPGTASDAAHPPAEPIAPAHREAWRAWLSAHHATSAGVWLVYPRKGTRIPGVSYAEAVEEALCFGWIDSVARPLDGTRWMQRFTPRKAGSAWSRLNQQRVERMIGEGRMTPAGMEKIEVARRDGSWSRLDAVERLEVPADLAAALALDPAAAASFHAFPRSTRKRILGWIQQARRPETRERRIHETVEGAARNERVR